MPVQYFLANRLPLFLCVLIGLPVPHRRIFPQYQISACPGKGSKILDGASDMPPTFVPWLPKLAAELWNAVLAKFVWKEYSLLELKRRDLPSYRVMYGNGRETVMPKRIKTRFVAVRHGREACRFALLNSIGDGEDFTVVARGSEDAIHKAIARELLDEGMSPYELNALSTKNFVTFV